MPILQEEINLYPDNLLSIEPAVDTDRRWWAIYTKSRQEKALARQLVGLQIPFYLPLVGKNNVIRGRRVKSLMPLFGGYVFVYGTDFERVQTLTTNRISRILPVVDGDQLRVDLANVYELIASDAPLTIEQRLAAGDRVRIRSGSLMGLEGTIMKRHGQTRLLVAVRYLQQGVSVQIDDFMVEPA
jgi:transcriptional antiterminator RfaH